MLLVSYSFSNFQSFLHETKVDFSVGAKTAKTSLMEDVGSSRLSKLMTVIGPNGSGKTALLKPIMFMRWFICDSFNNSPEEKIRRIPHFSAADQPSQFECRFLLDDTEWRYELVCTGEKVIYEALYRREIRFRYVFERNWDKNSGSYAIRQQNFKFPQKEAKRVRKNASLIATAAQYNVPLASRIVHHIRTGITGNIDVFGRDTFDHASLFEAAEHFSRFPAQKESMSNLLAKCDLGLTNISLEKKTLTRSPEKEDEYWLPVGVHKHDDKEYHLPLFLESSGTQTAFILLSWLLPILETGGIAVIDEFERDLHPHMLSPVLDLFANEQTNPYHAQIIFTSHSHIILNELHKSQIMLVQKNDNNESEAYRLDSIEGVRNDDNLYAKYISGAYGAIPDL